MVQADGAASYNWTPFDNVVRATTSRDMKVLAEILHAPGWARAASRSEHASLGSVRTCEVRVGRGCALRADGRPRVRGLERVEHRQLLGARPDPARYTQLLKLAYTVIKAADATATVVSAGLSPYGAYGEKTAQRMNPVSFLEQMYANGAAGSFDAVGWHPYNYPWGLSYATWSEWSQMTQTTPSARSLMLAHGDGARSRSGRRSSAHLPERRHATSPRPRRQSS